MRYKNNGGSHGLLDGTTIKPGEQFDSDDPELQVKFPNKFEKVASTAPVAAPTPTPAVTAPVEAAPAAPDANGPHDGTDVTKEFPTAGENDLKVSKDKAGYWVLDDGDTVNEKALRTKPAVVKAIADYIKE